MNDIYSVCRSQTKRKGIQWSWMRMRYSLTTTKDRKRNNKTKMRWGTYDTQTCMRICILAYTLHPIYNIWLCWCLIMIEIHSHALSISRSLNDSIMVVLLLLPPPPLPFDAIAIRTHTYSSAVHPDPFLFSLVSLLASSFCCFCCCCYFSFHISSTLSQCAFLILWKFIHFVNMSSCIRFDAYYVSIVIALSVCVYTFVTPIFVFRRGPSREI